MSAASPVADSLCSVQGVISPAPIITRRRQRFLDHLFGEASLDPILAARLAGFAHPAKVGNKLYRLFSQVIESKVASIQSSKIMSNERIIERLTEIAESDANDRVKAISLLMTARGMLEKLGHNVNVYVDSRQLNADFGKLAGELTDKAREIGTGSEGTLRLRSVSDGGAPAAGEAETTEAELIEPEPE